MCQMRSGTLFKTSSHRAACPLAHAAMPTTAKVATRPAYDEWSIRRLPTRCQFFATIAH
eukprot:CAMPEP_0174712946 /NCGR_PEP_ID=MMETSP1094-20130205/13775_1 /TAXON_ID=156173 /ORGANISM="Chrysochromulina brevifilum, Strain UTEX LB 985" /LENGTH=58 /DNA_ID=CAMNT_0015912067 /DNA_START=151 /DNA_END=327 /DNA_ORIENTATION=-